MLRRHPVVLARFAALAVDAAAEAAESGLRRARADLGGAVPPEVLEAAINAYELERHRLRTLRRAVELVEGALRGERWVPRL